ncbi:MAG: response regulator [Bdellovibrionales bacterium]
MTSQTRILVVEDNDFVRMQIVKFLESAEDESYEVIEASDGQAAIDVMNDNIDLAIVDVRMEPIDGFEFIRHIRGEGNEAPVILVTGDSNPDLLSEANKWNVGAVLMKPVQKDRLVKTVSRTLFIKSRAS